MIERSVTTRRPSLVATLQLLGKTLVQVITAIINSATAIVLGQMAFLLLTPTYQQPAYLSAFLLIAGVAVLTTISYYAGDGNRYQTAIFCTVLQAGLWASWLQSLFERHVFWQHQNSTDPSDIATVLFGLVLLFASMLYAIVRFDNLNPYRPTQRK